MRFLVSTFGKPLLFAGLLVFAILGTYRGTAVRDDFTWFIGALVAVGGVLHELRIATLRDRVEALERSFELRDRDRRAQR